jgi:hypothetical protein
MKWTMYDQHGQAVYAFTPMKIEIEQNGSKTTEPDLFPDCISSKRVGRRKPDSALAAVDSVASKTRIQTAPFCVLSALLCLGAYGSVETGAAAKAATRGVFPPPLTVAEKRVADSHGSEFRECADTCPLMVVIPAGKSTMGSSMCTIRLPPASVPR